MDESRHYDVVIIGSGPGGGTMAWRLAQTGKRVLLLERGDYLPRERENWDSQAVFVDARYQTSETWYGADGAGFHPGLHYYVGGNSKVYGAVLLRLRERDFGAIRHADGVSPEWPLKYDVFEPYYQAAEELYHVHGLRGEDPTEPPAPKPYAYPPVSHEPRIQALFDGLKREGHRPFHLPVGVLLDERDGKPLPHSACIRCDAFDGYPCLTNGKADAQVICVDPALRAHPNLTLMTGSYVERLVTDPAGRTVTGVEVRRGEATETYAGDLVVVACGALSSALLLLRSASDAHPHGLANGSGQVGRNYMRHNNATVLAISRSPNPTKFQKTLGLNDFYFGADDWEFPLGHIQMVGKSDGVQIHGEGLPGFLQWFPEKPFDWLAKHSLDFWLTAEDLPRPENRVFYENGRVRLDLTQTNEEAMHRLKGKLRDLCGKLDVHPQLFDRSLYLGKDVPIGGTAHQAGTLRFGTDPATSVLDLDCKAHELDNLYVTDASFFPSIGAVNPTLTIIANALRVGDHLARRLGA
ncbi:6'''-hydroxyparomomycin C oxidase [Methylobacterium crusticola]|uniref:6'''-hydroxyparomomycin C oxidase n=1 Tax=Methylobacterium crusticola TaxID=1697972 RepID=A0ABQ4QUI8_9HYPH|nr:GMC family oxidoreductase [Methylobacterium crusticola]GJD48716.1 6'''-hydroxyparomomycin C oxidase [Methylobacterium crusticola]